MLKLPLHDRAAGPLNGDVSVSEDPNDLVTVYKAENSTEAHLVKNLLADEGIEAAVAEEHEQITLNITPTEILVRRSDEARARIVIEEYDEEQERRANRPDWKCPACGATVHRRVRRMRCLRRDAPGQRRSRLKTSKNRYFGGWSSAKARWPASSSRTIRSTS